MIDRKKGRLASLWSSDDAERTPILERARRCASLTKPWVLPPKDQSPDSKLPENYQSDGARGVTNLIGKMVMALFPPEEPWFNLVLDPEIKHDPQIPAELVEEAEQRLFIREVIIQSVLESAGVQGMKRPSRRSGFRSGKLTSLTQLIVTGDTLEQLTDDYRLRVYRMDQYVTRRDSCGDVLHHGIKETIDPLSLGEEVCEKAGLKPAELRKKTVSDRMIDLFTFTEWQPETMKWVVTQELNGITINTSEETISQFFATAAELSPGEHYGRGFVEQNYGDLASLDELEKRKLQFAELCSKFHPCVDIASEVRDEDLARPSGTVLRGVRVADGQVKDIAFLKIDKYPDFRVVYETASEKRKSLNAAMLVESEVTPRGDRVTKYQASRVARELEGALGGFYAPIADEQQQPLLRRVIHQLQKDKVIEILPEDTHRVVSLTGLAALSREVKASRITNFAAVASQLGETAIAKIDQRVLMDVLARYENIAERGLVKTNQQIDAEQQAAIAAQTQLAAAEKGVEVAGNVAEANLTATTP